ncbi:hypothetical protein JHK85_010828 [Glycine max]|nr:hypothetical protein JHK85_010828 [Glycine max]KAG5066806.1 hypothetical protein JHK86_010537 [Glycine max]
MEGEGSDLLEKVPKEALSTMDQNLDGPAIPLSDVELLRGFKLNLEYEGLHSICFRCGRVGHKKEQCSEIMVKKVVAAESEVGTSMI